MRFFYPVLRLLAILLTISASNAFAEEAHTQLDSAKYAKQLANPVSALISVPFQLNYDDNIGPGLTVFW
jgi:hypothetical protein